MAGQISGSLLGSNFLPFEVVNWVQGRTVYLMLLLKLQGVDLRHWPTWEILVGTEVTDEQESLEDVHCFLHFLP